jgi:Zn-dependent peptidase ImmA (M78 family)
MPRKTFPRRDDHHRVVAGEILEKHARRTGRPIELPVPIELIIESTFGLEIVFETLDEPPDTMILGALYPHSKRIVLNERHTAMFETWIGPERFTLAHELSHWIYDADDPNQLSLDLDHTVGERFCYHREAPGLADEVRIREINANKLASHLLLPEHLVRAVDIDTVLDDFRATAAHWGVSQKTLRIRLETLGLIDDLDVQRLNGT